MSTHPAQDMPAWESEKTYFSGATWFADLLADIESARNSICLQTYIFELDHIGQRVLQALLDAAARGVRVQVIVDGFGSSSAIGALQKALAAAGADLHIYHPLPWQWFIARTEHVSWLNRVLLRIQQLNNRQHSKLLLLDDHTAWVGSFNITDKHLATTQDGSERKDCGARITGQRCRLLHNFFQATWDADIDSIVEHFPLEKINTRRHKLRKNRLETLLEQIRSARTRIWITSGYFAPVRSVLTALAHARRRGIDVRIIVPTQSDIGFFPALSSTYYADLLRAGIDVYTYLPAILHAKSMIIDDRVQIGSSNFNHRSLLHDVELDIQLFSEHSRQELEQDFTSTLQQCRKVSLDHFTRRYAGLLVLGQIPRLLRYWL